VAEQEPETVERWEAVVAAWRQAEATLGPGSDSREPQIIAAHLREAQDNADAARRDQALLDAVAEVRSSKQDLGRPGADAAYARAFGEASIDVDTLPRAQAGARLKSRPSSVVLAAVAARDDWALVRRSDKPKDARWQRPLEAARAADPDPYRDEVRAAVLDSDEAARESALHKLAADARVAELPPASAVLLAATLKDVDAKTRLLRTAASRHPDDVWVNYDLARVLDEQRPSAHEEAVRYYSAARALRPETAHELAHLLERMGRGTEAEAVFRDLVGRRPENARHLGCLGNHLSERGRSPEAAPILDRAIVAYRAAIRLKPDDAGTHYSLGAALTGQGKVDEAIAEYREAIRLKPDYAEAHGNLGAILCDVKHDYPGAEAEFREAIRLKPDLPTAHYSLGMALRRQGKVSEAIAEYREAIRLKPDAKSLNSLGMILCDVKHDYTGAEAEFREAIRLKPDLAQAHHNLGVSLQRQGNVPEAVAEYREAIRLKPDHAEAHCNLGIALRSAGDYTKSLAMLQRGHELGLKQPGWQYPSAKWVAETERLAALAERLPALLKGDDRPADNAERLALAQMCYDTKRHASAARFWTQALAADPKLADDRRVEYRYNAACTAALAAAGQATNDPKPDDAARAKLRTQALDWLKAELGSWAKVLDSGDANARQVVAQTVQHWQVDPDLAGIRDGDALAKLPEAERKAWQDLWAEVDALLARARGGKR
jgi:tetratricopeptide (TPR) repeat protein